MIIPAKLIYGVDGLPGYALAERLMFDPLFLFLFSYLQEEKEKLEKQLHDMAVVIERLESSRQKLLVEVVVTKLPFFFSKRDTRIGFWFLYAF